MAARFDEETLDPKECANCGAEGQLKRCSRCHSAYFCSLACHKAYWPFHKEHCQKNEFADALENVDPKFSRWMRKHRKQAVLKDDQVDRLERSRTAVAPMVPHEDVMASMYGNMDPKPKAPSYSKEELQAMRREHDRAALLGLMQDEQDKAWDDITVTPAMGVATPSAKWRQNLSHVELFFKLPKRLPAAQVWVEMSACSIVVVMGEDIALLGDLHQQVDPKGSHWFIVDGVLHISLLKCSRKGHYTPGHTAANTWWNTVTLEAAPSSLPALPHQHPPLGYYWSECSEEDLGTASNIAAACLDLPTPHMLDNKQHPADFP